MNNATFADWSTWSAPFTELLQINQNAAEKVVRECIAYCSDNAAHAVRCTQAMQRVTSPQDYISTCMNLFTKQGEKNLEFMQNLAQIYQDAAKEHCNWTEDKVNNAMKTANKVAKRPEDDRK